MVEPLIEIFNKTNLASLNWPDTTDGRNAKAFLTPLITEGISTFFHNIQADIYALRVGSVVMPLVVSGNRMDNSYVCSPYGHYIACGKEAVSTIQTPMYSKSLQILLNGLEKVVHGASLNSVVYVNNWLFSTDIYPSDFKTDLMPALVKFLTEQFPSHAICLRSLNPISTPQMNEIVKKNGFKAIASRHIYLTNTQKESIFKTRILKSDLKLWREKPYEVIETSDLKDSEIKEILSLYYNLYIQQHSPYHPQPTLEYMRLLVQKELFNFKILKIDGNIHGVAGYFERNGTLMCPFLGFDKNHPDHNLIYRLLSISLLLEARDRKLLFHQGSGASFYKSIRRADDCLESMAVYSRHLPWKQKISWKFFTSLINLFAPRFMKKF